MTLFFIFSKICWIFLSPLNFILLLMLTGAFIMAAKPRLGQACLFTGIMLFCMLGLLPLGHDLLAGLENQYVRPAKMPRNVTGILVLGGTFETELSEKYGFPVIADNIERVLDGLKLARAYPDAKIIFSGGEGTILHQDHPESKDITTFLKYYDITTPPHVLYESKSRNTFENLKFSHDLAKPQPGETWLLVTSAFHMKRAMAAAKIVSWTMVPWPTSYKTDGQTTVLPSSLDVGGNFYETEIAAHEYIGLLAYRLHRK